MRVTPLARLAIVAAVLTTFAFFNDNQRVFGQELPAGVQRFAWRTGENESIPATTVLRASTDTGISEAHIDREVAEPVRVAAVPDLQSGATMPAIGRVRSKLSSLNIPAAPEMKRRGFLVGFRTNRQDAESTAASSIEPAVSVVDPAVVVAETNQAGTVQSAPQPEIPAADQYADAKPLPPETTHGDHQFPGASVEPPLTTPSNAQDQPDLCCRDCSRDWCNLGCEKKLFPTYCNGLEIGGWFSHGYHNRETIMTNNRRDEWNLHQAWLYVDKTASRDTCNWNLGYHTDILYGIDAQDLQAFGNGPTGAPSGWDNNWDFGEYGWALPQLYVQFANYDWDVKVGKFFSPFGYEVIGVPDNFFYSHSYTMYNSEPFTMSGVLAERRMSDTKSVAVGATAGWDTAFESNEGGGNVIFGTRNQINEDINLAITNSWGDAGTRGNGRLTSAVAQVALTESIDYVFQADVLNLDDNNEFGVVQYLFKEISPCISVGSRLEWWKSDQFFANTRSTYGYTMGANIRRTANTVIRPELRFDWGAAAIDPGTPILGIDAIVTF